MPTICCKKSWSCRACWEVTTCIHVDFFSSKCSALWICRHLSWLRATICSSRIPAKIIHATRTIWHTSSNFLVRYHDPLLWWANTRLNSSQSEVSDTMPLPSISMSSGSFVKSVDSPSISLPWWIVNSAMPPVGVYYLRIIIEMYAVFPFFLLLFAAE